MERTDETSTLNSTSFDIGASLEEVVLLTPSDIAEHCEPRVCSQTVRRVSEALGIVPMRTLTGCRLYHVHDAECIAQEVQRRAQERDRR